MCCCCWLCSLARILNVLCKFFSFMCFEKHYGFWVITSLVPHVRRFTFTFYTASVMPFNMLLCDSWLHELYYTSPVFAQTSHHIRRGELYLSQGVMEAKVKNSLLLCNQTQICCCNVVLSFEAARAVDKRKEIYKSFPHEEWGKQRVGRRAESVCAVLNVEYKDCGGLRLFLFLVWMRNLRKEWENDTYRM